MATHLDLEEQEQLDQLKAFWNRYGNLISWILIVVLGGYAAWNGWGWYQRDQGAKAAAMFDELDRAAGAGDAEKATRVLADLKDRFGRTAYASQGALLAAKVQADKGQGDAARASLTWVADNGIDAEYKTIARLRLAGVLLDARQYDDALKAVDGATAPGFEALAADRRGDILAAQGRRDDAVAAYRKAYQQMDSKIDYRRLIDAKLTALGASPTAAPAAAASSAAAAAATSSAAPASAAAAASGASK